MPPSDRWPVGLVAGVARALAAFAAAVRGRSSSRRWRARSACRAVCSFRALRRASPPSSGWPGSAVRDVSSSSARAWGTSTRLPALRSPPLAAIQPKPRGKAKGGRFHPRLYTKICVQKAPARLKPHRGRARADRMGNPVRKTGAKRIKSPEMPSNCARPDQRRAKRGIPNPKRPAERPEMGYQMSSRRLSVRYGSDRPALAT